jgi:hypothetical protein
MATGDAVTMGTEILTTTLSELNRLYGVYYEVVNKKILDSEEAQKAWTEYETYVGRYQKERGLERT